MYLFCAVCPWGQPLVYSFPVCYFICLNTGMSVLYVLWKSEFFASSNKLISWRLAKPEVLIWTFSKLIFCVCVCVSMFERCGYERIKMLATSHVHIKAKVKFSLCVTWRHMGDCSCSITHSWPYHCVEVSGHIHVPPVLPVWRNNP